ncbi:MAG: hypothetical protein WCO88_16665 [Actinomycetota bacterium]
MSYDTNDDREERRAKQAASAARSGNSTMSPSFLGFVVVAVIAVLFFVKNSDEVELDFIFFDHITTVRWLIIISLVFGVLLDRLASMMWRRRQKRKARASLRD